MEFQNLLRVNPEKEEFVTVAGKTYACYAIRTPLITAGTDIQEIVVRYAMPHLKEGDILLVSEKMLACAQGKAKALEEIHPGFWAKTLSRHVQKTPYGIGLAIPETMECAIRECGICRILLAAAGGALGRLFHQKGWFYRIAGFKAAAVDGPCSFTIPPYNHYVVPAPDHPERVAGELKQLTGHTVLIIDCNDIGGKILGYSDTKEKEQIYLEILKQNPLGQSTEQTPLGIIRLIS
ncbi:MAG: coenzyme F420-0:L-glutamate ligase [Candidatus Merdivicinus sp.]|jgi:hypothetical protein